MQHAVEAQEGALRAGRGWRGADGRRGAGGARTPASASSNRARIFAKRAGEAFARGLAPFVDERVERREPVRRRRARRPAPASTSVKRRAMRVEPVAKRRGGAGRAGGRAPPRNRAASASPAARLASRDRPDGGMGVAVLGGGSRGGEGAVEVVERRERRGAEDAEFERARRGSRDRSASGRTAPRDGREAPGRRAGRKSRAASRMSRASAPASVSPSVRPAESSTSTPQRASSAETRRAIDGSGVIRAAVLPGVSRTSRIAIASASASSVSLSATITATPSSASATAAGASAASRIAPGVGRIRPGAAPR